MKDLINKQREYIEFLGKEIQDVSSFLIIHGWRCPQDVIEKGGKLREEIKQLEKKYE